ncbi:hypothetical protein RJ640_023972 [Escallonia rubra]|uniref:Chalcone/stilbene synthase N-terminal domain-containing protein n=1 Tax=Escallonia rubra TaxID=112253 RepID=A0AA88UKE9_9ASTE|nr:hypothetical protein RJ640_023972 [Escallonia rubra]
MPGADYQLTKLLGLRPSVKRLMMYQQGQFYYAIEVLKTKQKGERKLPLMKMTELGRFGQLHLIAFLLLQLVHDHLLLRPPHLRRCTHHRNCRRRPRIAGRSYCREDRFRCAQVQVHPAVGHGSLADCIAERTGSGVPKFKSIPPPSLPLSPPAVSPSSYFAIPPGLSPAELLDSPVLLSSSHEAYSSFLLFLLSMAASSSSTVIPQLHHYNIIKLTNTNTFYGKPNFYPYCGPTTFTNLLTELNHVPLLKLLFLAPPLELQILTTNTGLIVIVLVDVDATFREFNGTKKFH